ncbi:unnamed protein product [Symbiodinium necroappetens]|uniref:Uncharacterized protein n=1 Tax=Symbiodinium necroappetens TaxID=1628268 RepID=A0A812TQR9_9DINO|nr:unnamed protein product [Symbiodinium necroappetens]
MYKSSRSDIPRVIKHTLSKNVICFGSWLTSRPSEAQAYALRFAGRTQSSRALLLAGVLPGHFTRGKEGLLEPPRCDSSGKRFDATADDAQRPRVFCVFKDFQALSWLRPDKREAGAVARSRNPATGGTCIGPGLLFKLHVYGEKVSDSSLMIAAAAARRAATAARPGETPLQAALQAAKACWKRAEAERRARRRAKVGAKPKLRTKAPPEQSVEAGAIVVQAEHLAHEAAACKEAWDARAAVRLLRQSAALMESANAARKQLRRAANEVLQVLDVEDPKTRSLVGDALRTFGVQ